MKIQLKDKVIEFKDIEDSDFGELLPRCAGNTMLTFFGAFEVL